MGSQLTVRESQVAIFVNEGQIVDFFEPGRYTLTTENMPILAKTRSWNYGFKSPFIAEIYFVNTKQFIDQKWGTSNPIMMRDAEFGMLRLRAYGVFSFKVVEPIKFLNEVFGTNEIFDTENIIGQLKRSLISGITDSIAEAQILALDLARHYDELSEASKIKLNQRFMDLGLQLTSLFIENISIPEEVEKILDKRTSMGILGNMQQYTQRQAAKALQDAAQNSGNEFTGTGVALSTGNAIGNLMSDTSKEKNNQLSNIMTCPKCNTQVTVGSKYCYSCGNILIKPKVECIKCGFQIDQTTKFCPECGSSQSANIICKVCNKPVLNGSKFCTECGTKVE